jgi:hypothetical protein
MEFVLYVDNQHLTISEINAIRPEMDRMVKEVFGDRIRFTGNGYHSQYFNYLKEDVEMQELILLVRRLAQATTGKGPLEVNKFWIVDLNTVNGVSYLEEVQR